MDDDGMRQVVNYTRSLIPENVIPVNVLDICNNLNIYVMQDNGSLDSNVDLATFQTDEKFFLFFRADVANSTKRLLILEKVYCAIVGCFETCDCEAANDFAMQILLPDLFVFENLDKGFEWLRSSADVSSEALKLRLKNLDIEMEE